MIDSPIVLGSNLKEELRTEIVGGKTPLFFWLATLKYAVETSKITLDGRFKGGFELRNSKLPNGCTLELL